MVATVSALPKGDVLDANGKPNQQFVAFLQKIEKAANALPDLSAVTVPAEDDTAATVTTRSWDDSLNAVPGVDAGADPATLGNGGGTTVGDSFKKIANGLNALYLNDANQEAAIEELSDRVNALRTAVEELRAALAA